MIKSDRLKVVLFALTGFGNTVLEALLNDDRVRVAAVFTVKYDKPFPYYVEQHLNDLCEQRGIDCYHGMKVCSDEGVRLLQQLAPDLIVVATFKQILKENVVNLPPLGVINFHPSLLPRYRGPCPTNAALLNEDQVTGVTVHYITEKLDEGDILLQRSIPICETDYDGELRRKLAQLSGELVPEVIGMFADLVKPVGTPQSNDSVSLAPRPTPADGFLELATDVDILRRKVRALNPIPGTSILVGDKRVAVDRFELLPAADSDDVENAIDWVIGSRGIRLYKKAPEEIAAPA